MPPTVAFGHAIDIGALPTDSIIGNQGLDFT